MHFIVGGRESFFVEIQKKIALSAENLCGIIVWRGQRDSFLS